MLKTSNFLKSTLSKRSNVILRYSYGQCIRNLSTDTKGSKNILSKIADYRKPIVYNVKVLEEIAKEVYTKENLGPPNKAQISEAWENLKSIKWKNIYDLNPTKCVKVGIRSIEIAGFFAIGEIIGRFSLLGYNI
ncbi:mitochondrial ATP synthase g subunit-domain-containing protein [Glomus cerebriforme]|uniref:Mitochondrial ATP synthase g subunit-domain-containing protein n=1 Tax=Glomus cerebriforme TaxID=658196 RepID=A0A397TQJ7_9GLOM|nr:mitochondrial ATP synthase g subunit-domain-containing protein [Glomus cerebriforme]